MWAVEGEGRCSKSDFQASNKNRKKKEREREKEGRGRGRRVRSSFLAGLTLIRKSQDTQREWKETNSLESSLNHSRDIGRNFFIKNSS
jgi:hypothetical protein